MSKSSPSLSPIRLLMLLAAVVLALLALLLGLMLTDTLLNIRANLEQAPDWVWMSVLGGFSVFGLIVFWLMLRLLRPRRSDPAATSTQASAPVDEKELAQTLETSKQQGLDTRIAEAELAKLQQRRDAGEIHIALYGEISAGKSSLIKALLPDATIAIGVTGGTTQSLDQYAWISPAGDRLIVTDMPGLNENNGTRQHAAEQEAQRAHLVIYLCDGDLTRTQAEHISALTALQKPLILALSKSDRYDSAQLAIIQQRLQQRARELGIAELATISSGGTQQVVRVNADGSEDIVERERPARIDELRVAIQRQLDSNRQVLDSLRDSAVFSLIKTQLDAALAAQRNEQAVEITRSYSKKAVIASVATITPGSDLIIQGYLATQMVKDLAGLYDTKVRSIDIDLLLKLIQQHVRSHLTVLLAIAGNALKAFPGVGTLGGGVVHAIAYGLLFETLGKSIAESLRTRGELHPEQIASQFEDTLGEHFEKSAGHYAKLAIRQLKDQATGRNAD